MDDGPFAKPRDSAGGRGAEGQCVVAAEQGEPLELDHLPAWQSCGSVRAEHGSRPQSGAARDEAPVVAAPPHLLPLRHLSQHLRSGPFRPPLRQPLAAGSAADIRDGGGPQDLPGRRQGEEVGREAGGGWAGEQVMCIAMDRAG